jgi:hypothetical protein
MNDDYPHQKETPPLREPRNGVNVQASYGTNSRQQATRSSRNKQLSEKIRLNEAALKYWAALCGKGQP